MITILLASLLTCTESAWIIQGIRGTELSDKQKSELVLEVMIGTDPKCNLGEALEAEPRR